MYSNFHRNNLKNTQRLSGTLACVAKQSSYPSILSVCMCQLFKNGSKTLSENKRSQWVDVNETGVLSHVKSDTNSSLVGETGKIHKGFSYSGLMNTSYLLIQKIQDSCKFFQVFRYAVLL